MTGPATQGPSSPLAPSRTRRLVAGAVLLCAVAVVVVAMLHRRTRRAAPPPPPPPPRQDPGPISFGERRAGAQLDLNCTLDNLTSSPLDVADVRTTCGCTTVGPWPKRVEPNSAVDIPVRVQLPPDHHGPFSARVIVLLANPPGARSFLIEGSVFLPCPPEVDFGAVKRGDPAERNFLVRSTSRGKAVQIRSVRYDDQTFSVRHRRSQDDPRDEEVAVELQTGNVEGAVDSDLTLDTDDAAEPVKHVRLKGYVLRPVETDLTQLSFASVAGGEERRVSFRLYSPYDKAFEVIGIRVEPADFLRADTVRDADGRSITVNLTLHGPLPEKLLTGRAIVRVRCENVERELAVNLFAEQASAATTQAH